MSGAAISTWSNAGPVQQLAIGLFTYALHSTIALVLTLFMLRSLSLSSAERRHIWLLLLFLPLLSGLCAQIPGPWHNLNGLEVTPSELLALPLALSGSNGPGAVGATPFSDVRANIPTFSQWATLIVFIWLFGAVGNTLRFGLGWLRLKAQLADRRPCPDSRLQLRLQDLIGRSHLRRPATLSTSPNISSPCVLGRHEICLPECLLSELSEAERVAILGHELAHLEGEDGVLYPVLSLLSALFWMHPYNGWLSARWREDTELRCDERAVELIGDAVSLAQAVERVASLASAHDSALVPTMVARSGASARVRLLLNPEFGIARPRSGARWWPLAFVAAAAFLTPRVAISRGENPRGVQNVDRDTRLRQQASTNTNALLTTELAPDFSVHDARMKEFAEFATRLEESLSARRLQNASSSSPADSRRIGELLQQLRHLRARQSAAVENFEMAWHQWERSASTPSTQKEQ